MMKETTMAKKAKQPARKVMQPMDFVAGALVELIHELTALAKNANRAIDEDRERLGKK
jgi:hypothetical protein